MPNQRWDMVPVYGVWLRFDQSPEPGRVNLTVSQRINRTDGRIIYPGGATITAEIGNQAAQDPMIRAQVRGAWRAHDEAAQGAEFDGVAWDQWWDTIIVPAAIFTAFPASDDPDIVQTGYQVSVQETLTSGQGKAYTVQPLLAQLEQPIPGINLGEIDVPPGTPASPAAIYQKNRPGGVAGLDGDGKILAGQLPELGGGGPHTHELSDVDGLEDALTGKLDASATAGLGTPGWANAVVIPNGGTLPTGLPPFTIVIEQGA